MTASKARAVYLVDIKYLEEAVVQRWRNTLEDTEPNSRLAKVKALGLLPGSRSYKCEVVGVPGTRDTFADQCTRFHPNIDKKYTRNA
jgi:hypothetical protein